MIQKAMNINETEKEKEKKRMNGNETNRNTLLYRQREEKKIEKKK